MAKINKKITSNETTHEGAKAAVINPKLQLRRSVLSCMLWENSFYEEGKTIAERIKELVNENDAQFVADLAVEAREKMKLRHVPLLLCRELARHKQVNKIRLSEVLAQVIQRADELTEFLAIYWKEKRQPLSGQVKKGLAKAFTKFSEYDLAKYNRDEGIKLRDVLFLSHAKPLNKEQEDLWKKLVEGKLAVPDTWEVALSAGKDKRETWLRLLSEKKLGALALIRNLRNMIEAKVPKMNIADAIAAMKVERVLPFRFVTASRYAPDFEDNLEKAMLRCLEQQPKLPGKTVLIVDVSGSMFGYGNISAKSEITRVDAACALAMLIREISEEAVVYATAGNDYTRIHKTQKVPARRGFALLDVIQKDMKEKLGGGGIFLKQCMDYVYEEEKTADRVIVFTDEQDCDKKCNPATANAFGKENYLINISVEKNGIGYGKWVHIDGFSEAVVDFIGCYENSNNNN